MAGFFTKKQTAATGGVKASSVATCASCRLYKKCTSPKMKPTGKGKKKILIIAEAPSKEEDEKGTERHAGELLRSHLKDLGVDLTKDCWKTYAIICCPHKKEAPTRQQIVCCRPNILKAIETHKPKLIILLGGAAIESVIGTVVKKDLGGVTKWRGWTIPDRQFNCWICPTFHPSYLLKSNTSEVAELIFGQDLKRAVGMLNKHMPSERESVNVVLNTEHACTELKNLLRDEPKRAAFDYECTGLKPFAEGHKIVCCAIATSSRRVFAFLLNKKTTPLLVLFLKNKKIRKIAANLKYEEQWSRVILGTRVKGWLWDTMQASHILDNRRGINGLKFQVYVNFGLVDYDSHLSHLLKSKDHKNVNSINQIHKIDQKELLEYCGMDALLEYRLAMIQRRAFRDEN
jgi:uracil-DNA glycosylase family 4